MNFNIAQEKKIIISHISKVCSTPFYLTFEGNFTKLYYTTNGSYPTRKDKRVDSSLYINKTTSLLLRFRFKNNKDTIIARSFIFDTISKLPIVSISISPEDLWDNEKGIYTRGSGAYFDDSTGHWENCNFQKKLEKKVGFIYINSNRKEVVNQMCGLRIFGESTRRQPDKSLKIVARKEYGKKRFYYPFFNQKPHIKEHKQLVIRTSGNDYKNTRFKDVLNAYLARNLGLDYMAYQQIRLYINGEYWGVYNLREKINKHYLYYNHSAKEDKSNIIMGRWVVQHGNRRRYKKMYNWFFNLEKMDSVSYIKAKEYLDIRNYINYRAYQIFINNVDSRGNIRYWNSKDKDNKFRMILYDTDLSFGRLDRDYLSKCLSSEQTDWFNNTWSTIYLRKLMEYEEFRYEFINQYAHIMNTALHTDTIITAVDYFENLYKDELPRPGDRIAKHLKKVPIPIEKWFKKVNNFRYFAKKRPEIARNEITRVLAKDGTFYLKINGENGQVNINNNYPIPIPFEGFYYKNVPLPISILANKGYISDNKITKFDTIINTIKDTVVLTYKFIEIDTNKIVENKVTNTNKVVNKLVKHNKENINNNKLLWLIAWVFIGFGGVLLIIYFKLRV